MMKLYVSKVEDRDQMVVILARNGYTVRQSKEKDMTGKVKKSSLMSSHSFRKGVSRRRAAPKGSTTGSLSAL